MVRFSLLWAAPSRHKFEVDTGDSALLIVSKADTVYSQTGDSSIFGNGKHACSGRLDANTLIPNLRLKTAHFVKQRQAQRHDANQNNDVT